MAVAALTVNGLSLYDFIVYHGLRMRAEVERYGRSLLSCGEKRP